MYEKKFEVGELVQVVNRNEITYLEITYEGVVEEIIPAKLKRPEEYWKLSKQELSDTFPSLKIKLDNQDNSIVVSSEIVEVRDSEIQRKFRIALKENSFLIEQTLKEARTLLARAERLSEESGVPFYSKISSLSQCYCPTTFSKNFPGIDKEFVAEFTNVYDLGEYGWQHSAVC